MESQQQRTWVNVSYLAAAALLGYVVFSLGGKAIATFDLESRVRNVELVLRGSSVALGALLFVALWRSQRANQFMGEVFLELSRVNWPTQKDTTNATILVIIMVLISGFVLGFLDYAWTQILHWVL